MMTSADAKAFARIQHAGQVDETDAPFIEHLERVAHAAEGRARHAQAQGLSIDPERTMQAAWLHDVLEDTPTTVSDLFQAGFSKAVVEIVFLLSRKPEFESYDEHLEAVAQSANLDAILIALSEIEDCIDPETAKAEHRETLTERFAVSRARLRMAAAALGYTGP